MNDKDIIRLLNKIAPQSNGCWLWTGAPSTNGYGMFRLSNPRRLLYAHRLFYELLVGPIPDGLEIDHLCRNRACQNPDHMEPVTSQINTLRGNGPAAQHARKTHCPKSHLLYGENLYINPQGGRCCRECHRIGARRRYATRMRMSA